MQLKEVWKRLTWGCGGLEEKWRRFESELAIQTTTYCCWSDMTK